MLKKPNIHANTYIAKGAVIIGDVTMGEDASVWFNATIRAERAEIVIGKGTNIQDNAVVHVDEGVPTYIGEYVTVGHGAIVHGCSVGDHTLVGMGAIILNNAKIGKNCIIGAGALVTQNTVIPDGSLVIGSPAKVKRELTEDELKSNLENALGYVEEGKEYKESGY